jgi:bifunctional DNA-binding transcriptional regulator/antitoxin component of YhaV-PrlF toxin-antitoxin module
VTIPKDIRDELGLRSHDKIAFTIENGQGFLHKAYPSLEEIVASVPAIDVPMEEWDEIIQDEIARRYAEDVR